MAKAQDRHFTSVYKKLDDITIIILAGTPGIRMRSYGPKILLKLNTGGTILDKLISNVKDTFPNADIIISVGFEADRVIKKIPKDIRIVENQLCENSSVIEECRLAINNATKDKLLFIHGDLIFEKNVLSAFKLDYSSVLVDENEQLESEDVGTTIVDGNITIFSFGLPTKWAYIAYLTGTELDLFKYYVNKRENNRLVFYEGLNYILERNGIIKEIKNKYPIQKVDALGDIR